jgi:hypothetical protein
MIAETEAGEQGVSGEPAISGLQTTMSMRFPAQFLHDVLDARSRMPTQAPTGSTSRSLDMTPPWPATRIPGHAQERTVPSATLGFAGGKARSVVGVGVSRDDDCARGLGQDLDDEGWTRVAAFVPFAGDLFSLGRRASVRPRLMIQRQRSRRWMMPLTIFALSVLYSRSMISCSACDALDDHSAWRRAAMRPDPRF